jgi:hypothetical protein
MLNLRSPTTGSVFRNQRDERPSIAEAHHELWLVQETGDLLAETAKTEILSFLQKRGQCDPFSGAPAEAQGQRGQECSGPAFEPQVPRLRIPARPGRPAQGEREVCAGLQGEGAELTGRARGRTISQILTELRKYILGWRAHFGFAEATSPLLDLDKWIRRRLRSYHWKQWGRRGCRELRRRRIPRDLAWNTAKSAHGPWRPSQSPALAIALPVRYFTALGLPSLVEGRTDHPIRRTAAYVIRTCGGVGGEESRGPSLSRLSL